MLKRDARTHHLCNLGGILKTYLKDPSVLDEDDARRILNGVFVVPKVQMALNRLLAEKRKQFCNNPGYCKTACKGRPLINLDAHDVRR